MLGLSLYCYCFSLFHELFLVVLRSLKCLMYEYIATLLAIKKLSLTYNLCKAGALVVPFHNHDDRIIFINISKLLFIMLQSWKKIRIN